VHGASARRHPCHRPDRRAGEPGAGQSFGGSRHGSDFQQLHRNKKSLSPDLKSPAGREVLGRLVDRADVLIENMRPPVKHRLGFDYDTVHTRNPRLAALIAALCREPQEPGELSAVVSLVCAALSGRAQCGVDCLRLQSESPPHLVAGVRRVAGDLGSTCSPAGVVGDLRGGDVFLAHVPEDEARLYGRAASVVADADSGPWACPAAYVWPGEAVLVLQEFQLPDCLAGERLLADVHLLSICRADRCRQIGLVKGERVHQDILAMAGGGMGIGNQCLTACPGPGCRFRRM
jgi:hypothetical protein